MRTYRGRFGLVTVSEYGIAVQADGADTNDWANRHGAVWPASDLSGRPVMAGFDRGGLVDLEWDETRDLSGDELTAWAYDAVADAVPADIAAPWLRVIDPESYR